MKMALDTIKAKIARGEYTLKPNNQAEYRTGSNLVNQFNVTTSHRYIKFTPQNEEELALLKQDSTIILADYPLDYEFDDMFYTNRPELVDGQMPEYFASVSSEKSLPNVSNEELAELYIPEEDIFFNEEVETPITKKTVIGNEEDLLHHLLYEAYALVGKEQELLDDSGKLEDPVTGVEWWFFGRRWSPSGTLQVWDDIGGTSPGGFNCYQGIVGWEYLDCASDTFVSIYDCTLPIYGTICDPLPPVPGGGFVPLRGAQVLMRQWFTVDSGITDANGRFSTGTVRGKARYVIQWERYQYSIRNGSIFQAETRGPKVKNVDWNKNIVGGDDEYHAIIHTAAHDYYYGDRFGLGSPPENGFLNSQIKIAARESAPLGVPSSFSHSRFELTFGLLAHIHVKAYGRNSDEIYATTIHELAHAAHWKLSHLKYDNIVRDSFIGLTEQVRDNNRRLLETWPSTVETLFTVRRYRDFFGIANYTHKLNNLQNQTIAEEGHYTSAGVDMLEGNYGLPINNQGLFDNTLPIDRVNGYTINQLESALGNSNSWWKWRDIIFNIVPNNPTRNNLEELFNNW